MASSRVAAVSVTDQLVRVLHALIEGPVFQRLLTPELVPDEIFRAAFGALAVKGTMNWPPRRSSYGRKHWTSELGGTAGTEMILGA